MLVVVGPLKTAQPRQAESEGIKSEPDFAHVSTAARQEWKIARADHQAVVFAIVPCLHLDTSAGQPGVLSGAPILDVMLADDRQRPLTANQDTASTTLKMTSFHRAALYLSNAVARARIETMGSAHDSYSRMQYFQIATVILGAVTTIRLRLSFFIWWRIKTTSIDNTRLSLLIGILAIIFSSVGTATSALNSFYSPREGYIRNQKSLSVLKKLHMEIATTVSSQAEFDTCTAMTEENSKKVKEWSARLGGLFDDTETAPHGGGQMAPGTAGGNSMFREVDGSR